MATDNRKIENSNPRPEKPEPINDLPAQPQSDKEAEQVKGGMRKNIYLNDR